jgi:hypothetical protein
MSVAMGSQIKMCSPRNQTELKLTVTFAPRRLQKFDLQLPAGSGSVMYYGQSCLWYLRDEFALAPSYVPCPIPISVD